MEIKVSDVAVNKLKELEVGGDNYLRLAVVPGGCSGYTYEAMLDDTVHGVDYVIYDDKGIKVITDKNSMNYLDGLEIEYSDDLVQPGFRFLNKKAVKTCGCGSSFSCG